MIVVEFTGPLATVQDLGRPGLAYLGVPPSGAADRYGHRLANRLVGNRADAATIEVTGGGLQLRAEALCWVSVTGAQTDLNLDGQTLRSHHAFPLHEGQTLTIQPSPVGWRNYLGIRGGVKITSTLGSRSTDILTGLGPAPLVAGQRLRLCRPRLPLPTMELAPPNPPHRLVDVQPGPRRDWFTLQAWQTFVDSEWTATPESDRVAVRLAGPVLDRAVPGDLPAEGLRRGAVQVSGPGELRIFLADHPVVGDLPVIGVLPDRATDHAAQLRPGDRLRLTGRPLQ